MAYSRKRFWIEVPLQLRILLFVLLLLAVTLALAYLSVSRGLEQAAIAADRPFVSVPWVRQAVRFPFLLASGIALLAGTLLSFLWAHRLIGPLMVLTAGLKRLGQGDLTQGLELRESDLQWETTEEFERLRESLRTQAKLLGQVQSRLDTLSKREGPASEELRAVNDELGKVASFFRT